MNQAIGQCFGLMTLGAIIVMSTFLLICYKKTNDDTLCLGLISYLVIWCVLLICDSIKEAYDNDFTTLQKINRILH